MNTNRTSKAFRVRAAITLLLLLLTSTTVWAETIKVPYFDSNGEHEYETTATITENAITDLGNGWYVISGNYSSSQTLTFTGDVNLILADDADGTITGANGIVVLNGSLTFYGQSGGTGSLSARATGDKNYGGYGIYAKGNISIIGGTITTTSDYNYGIYSDGGDITINGGTVTAKGSEGGIDATGNITLGYTKDTDRIFANSYGVASDKSISISSGKTMIDGETSYSGTLTSSKITNISNKILAPNLFGIGPNNDGSSSNKPYIINSPEGLQLLATYVNSGTICYVQSSYYNDVFYVYKDKYFKLNYDIAFNSNIVNNFTPIGGKFSNNYYAFCGSFDGDGHTISGINIYNNEKSFAGIFGYIESGASISNVTLINASISGKEYIGGIAGNNKGGSISNCLVANTTITNSITGNRYIGAITGLNSGTLYYNYYGNSIVKEHASGVGCGTDNGSSDVNANDGAVSATFLRESEEVPSDLSGKVLFYREFTGGKASTICLPFAYTPKTNDGTFYTFDGITKKGEGSSATYEATMTAVTSTSLSPNMPYLFVPAGDNTLKPVLFHGTAASSISPGTTTNTPWSFIGTYKRLAYYDDISSLSDEDKASALTGPVYGFAAKTKDVGVEGQGQVEAGEFVRAMTGAYVPAMRCYLKYNNPASTRGETEELPGRITVKLVGDPTSIGTLNTQTGEVTFDGWYSLDGQRFNSKPTKKGLYIYKGIKVTIK